MTILTREISFTYGALTIGGSSQYYIPVEKYTYQRSFKDFEFSCQILVRDSTHTGLETRLDALVTEVNKRDQDFSLTVNSRELITCKPSTNTGLNTRATMSKSGHEMDTGISSVYDFSVQGDLPSVQYSGRRTSSVSVQYQDSRLRTVTLQTVYTALASNDARAQYSAAITAYASAVQSALSISAWKLLRETIGPADDQTKTVEATQVYREQHTKEKSSLFDRSEIRNLTFTINRNKAGPGDFRNFGEGPKRFISVNAYVQAGIDVNSTTDEDSIWSGTIEPAAISEVLSAFGTSSQVALMTSEPEIDWVNNRIRGRLFFLVMDGSGTVEQSYRRVWNDEKGKAFIPVVSADPYSVVEARGPGRVVVTEMVRRRFVGPSDDGQFSSLFGGIYVGENSAFSKGALGSVGAGGISFGYEAGNSEEGEVPAGPGNYSGGLIPVLIRENHATSPETLGIPDSGHTLEATSETITRVWRMISRAEYAKLEESEPLDLPAENEDPGAGGDSTQPTPGPGGGYP
jgi:hypothetical protein